MPWTTPSLRQVRETVRDDVTAALSGAVLIGNSVLRVMSDAMAGLAHLVLRYIDWLARQLMPDTAEVEWLDRHGDIWLVNADGSIGRRGASYADGTVAFTGTTGTVVANNTGLEYFGISYETIQQITIGEAPTEVGVVAISPGIEGNVLIGSTMTLVNSITGVDDTVTVTGAISGGLDQESDELLRERVLLRIRQPPMGGDQMDYVEWTLAVEGVTRAWCSPLEMGIGTVTVRFMMDDLRASDDGFPGQDDVIMVKNYLDTVRPVAVKDFFVQAPIAQGISFTISNLQVDSTSVRAAIESSVKDMLFKKAEPGQTIYRSWLDEAIALAPGVDHYELAFDDAVMDSGGNLAVLGTITYG